MKKLLMLLENKYPKLYEIFKFLVVGGCATVIDIISMAIILYLFDPALYDHNLLKTILSDASPSNIATVIGTGTGFILGLIFNYIFSIIVVFNRTNTDFAKTKKGFISFAALSSVGFLIHTVGMAIGYGILNIDEWIIKIVLTLVVLIFNYISRKKIIFKETKKEEVLN